MRKDKKSGNERPDRAVIERKTWRSSSSRIVHRAVRLAALTSLFVVMILISLAPAMAFVQSHNLSEIRNIDTHLNMGSYTIQAAGLNLTGGLSNCNLKTSGGVTYCGSDDVNDADANPSNEIQTLGTSGNSITLTSGGSVVAPYATSAGNADTLDSYHYTSFGGALDTSGNNIRLLNPASGVLSTITAPYATNANYANTAGSATSAGNADTVDGYHYSSSWPNAADTLTGAGTGTGTSGYIPRYTGMYTMANSVMYQISSNIGVGSTGPLSKLSVNGNGYSNTAIYGKQPSYTNTWGALGYYDGADYYGVYGRATDFNFDWYGVYGLGNAAGVYGKTTSTFGDAVVADCAASGCRGLVAFTTDASGLAGYFATGRVAINNGGTASACESGLCVGGNGVANAAIYGEVGSSGQYGIYGRLNRASYDGYGIFAQADNTPYYGIGLRADGGYKGVEGQAHEVGTGTRIGVQAYASGGSTNYGVWSSGTTYNFYAAGSGTDYGTFTGAHEVKLSDDFPTEFLEGMVVSVTGDTEIRRDEGDTIGFSSTLPTINLSCKKNDKAVLGVILEEAPLPGTDEAKDDGSGYVHWYKPKPGERFGIVNALGEGRVLVTNMTGPLTAGDYLTTSEIPGYAQKQDDDLLHGYTLAKVTENVDWKGVTDIVTHEGKSYKTYPVAAVYTSG